MFYAPHFPEAIPLCSMMSPKITDELLKWIVRVGMPKEILIDQGTNFMARAMRGVCKVLWVKRLKMSVYHPQTGRLDEQFNCTLKLMLRKCIEGDPKKWDQMLIPLMFTI